MLHVFEAKFKEERKKIENNKKKTDCSFLSYSN